MSNTKVPGYLGNRLMRFLALAGCASALLAACCLAATAAPAAASVTACPYVPITGAGSTESADAIDEWVTDVGQDCMQVSYAAVGSASGLMEFGDGTVDFGASDVPYGVALGSDENPAPSRGYTYMPDTAGGVAFLYNLQIGGHYVTNLRLSGAVIAGIFTNQITMWNDPAIAADNPALALPAEPIVPVVRADPSGTTWAFTQWLSATESSSWTAYCAATGLSPCSPTTTYPVQSGTDMVAQSGDLGVPGYVSQPTAEGTIGFTDYGYALETGYPVADVLNAAGYYTAPTPDNVGISLLSATVNPDGTENLSEVYTDTDPRTYELSYYSYLILPTDTSFGFTDAKGYSLSAFAQFALCQGQQEVDALGYGALPINLVEDAYGQLQNVPGNQLPSTVTAFIQGCDNPTFGADGTDTLLTDAPMPPACDQQGPAQCVAVGLTATPNPALVGEIVTLTATTTESEGAFQAGSVQFEVGGVDIGGPIAVNASGVATTTTTAGSAGTIYLTAVFTPTDPAYPPSTDTYVLTVNLGTGTVPVTATVPPTGTFTVTVPASATLTQSGATATGFLPPITVSDSRNTYPGWSVSALAGNFTGTGLAIPYTIEADDLGWVPGAATLPAGISLGPAIPAGTSPGGLGDAGGVLADAAVGYGYGTYTFNAALTLDIPAEAPAGSYTGTLTITYLESGP